MSVREELTQKNGRKSFYGKAYIMKGDGVETLYSYDTPIVRREKDGTLVRLWHGWSATTGSQIKSFCGLNKKEFDKLQEGKS